MGTSPYVRYEKRPYKYSPLYYQWREAIMRGDKNEATRLSIKHSRMYGMDKNNADTAASIRYDDNCDGEKNDVELADPILVKDRGRRNKFLRSKGSGVWTPAQRKLFEKQGKPVLGKIVDVNPGSEDQAVTTVETTRGLEGNTVRTTSTDVP